MAAAVGSNDRVLFAGAAGLLVLLGMTTTCHLTAWMHNLLSYRSVTCALALSARLPMLKTRALWLQLQTPIAKGQAAGLWSSAGLRATQVSSTACCMCCTSFSRSCFQTLVVLALQEWLLHSTASQQSGGWSAAVPTGQAPCPAHFVRSM